MYSWSIRVVENRQSARGHRAAHDLEPARREPGRVARVVARDDLLLEDPVQVLRVGPVLGAPRRGSSRVRRWPSRCPRSKPSSHQPSRTLMFGTPFWAAFMPGRAGRLERAARVVEPDVDALDQEPADAHVVVLEDEDAAAQLRRARALEDLLDDLLPGPVGRVGLAGEDDLDRPVRVPQQPGEPVDVAEQQARRACRWRTGGRSRWSGSPGRARVSSSARTDGASPWRANWLRSRPWAKWASSRFWRRWASHRSRAGTSLDPLPEAALAGRGVEVVEVGVEIAGEQVGDRRADPGRAVDAVGDAQDVVVGDARATCRSRSGRGAG